MKILYSPDFLKVYTRDPAASAGRLEPTVAKLENIYEFVRPEPAREDDILLVHSKKHLEGVKRDQLLYGTAMLAAGATIAGAEIAAAGEPAFALCRPPGHHASPDSCWGFCYFNNIAVAVEKFLVQQPDSKVLVVDFDLHYGDGTENALAANPAVTFFDVPGNKSSSFIEYLRDFLQKDTKSDLIAVSAGFDRHVEDWGGMLTTEDYRIIGELLGEHARTHCSNRIFAALEGGYNSRSLAESIHAFLEGLEG